MGILCDVAAAIGGKVTLSDGTSGAVQLTDAETEPHIGTCVGAGAIGEHSAIDLQISS